MRRNIGTSILKFVAFCLLFLSSTLQANAQNIDDYISIAPADDWVEIQDIPSEEFALSTDQKLTYKLLSYQTRVSKSDHQYYHRRVVDLQNSSAVEDRQSQSPLIQASKK